MFLADIQNQTIWTFDHIENKHSLYRGEDSLREYATNVTDFEKKENSALNKKS